LDSAFWVGLDKFHNKTALILLRMIVKTTVQIRSSLEHQIMEWAIQAELFEDLDDVENGELSGWSSWDRAGVLTAKRLMLDSGTPHIGSYSRLILRRLRGLQEHHTTDTYARAARDLEKRIHDANKGLFSVPKIKQLKTSSAHG
jgi:hypothetical protein